MFERRAIIIGNRGQDGRLLSALLRARGDRILGIGRTSVDADPGLPALEAGASVETIAKAVEPDEIYYLAAHHASSEESARCVSDEYAASVEVNGEGAIRWLEAIRLHAPRCRFFFASSSLIFGDRPFESPQTEATPPSPREPYSICKLLASTACRDYRLHHGISASVGILYNHESIYRGEHFLSMKIARAAAAAARGKPAQLKVGDLSATADWGYAPDFVDAFTRILSADEPGEYIVATGQSHTVEQFVEAAFGHVGRDWKNHVSVDGAIHLSRRRFGVVGDASRLRRTTGWSPSVTFEEMAAKLVDGEASQT